MICDLFLETNSAPVKSIFFQPALQRPAILPAKMGLNTTAAPKPFEGFRGRRLCRKWETNIHPPFLAQRAVKSNGSLERFASPEPREHDRGRVKSGGHRAEGHRTSRIWEHQTSRQHQERRAKVPRRCPAVEATAKDEIPLRREPAIREHPQIGIGLTESRTERDCHRIGIASPPP